MAEFLMLVAFVLFAVVVYFVLRTRRFAREAERLLPRVGQLQPVNGGLIHYVESGPEDGPVLVLIHGLSGQLQHFTYAMTEQLSDTFRVIAIDRPGCGYSERDNDGLAVLSEQARMIGEFLDAKGVDKPVLVGHSLGGALSLTMALDRPEKTAGVVLLCPATHEMGQTHEVFKGLEVKSPLLRRIIGYTVAVPIARKSASRVLDLVFRPDTCPDDFLIRAGGVLGLRPSAYIAASADATMMHDALATQVPRYDTLRLPGGVLFGAGDNIVAPAAHGDPMRAYGFEVDQLPGHGHMIPITAPDECVEFVRRIAAKVA